MSSLGARSLLFSPRKAKPAGNVLEVVSYWDNTVIAVDHIQAPQSIQLTDDVHEIISFSEDGCTLHLLPDMKARFKKGNSTEIDFTDQVINLSRNDIVQIKQGNLNFVLMFVNLPAVNLPQVTRRDYLSWAMLLTSLLLFLASATLIYLTKAVPVQDADFTPWLSMNKPVEIHMAQPQKSLPKPAVPAPLPPKALKESKPPVDTKPTVKEQQPPAMSGAQSSAPANKSGGPDLSALQRIAKMPQGTGPGSINFKPTPGGLPAANGSDLRGTSPGINTGDHLSTSGTSDAAGKIGKGATPSGTEISDGFGNSKGQARPDVAISGVDPVMGSGLRPDEVQKIIRTNLNQIRHCYEQSLQRNPGTSGKLKVNFVVGPDGRVTNAKIVEDTVRDSDMGNCVTSSILRWTFPVPRDGHPVNVNYPFIFNPR